MGLTHLVDNGYIPHNRRSSVSHEQAVRYIDGVLREASLPDFNGRVTVESTIKAGKIKFMRLDLEKTIVPEIVKDN